MQQNDRMLEEEIKAYLRRLGVPVHLKGSRYLCMAIMKVLEDESMLEGVTKRLYPSIAKFYSTSASCVERAMRNTIAIAWTTGDMGFQHELFGFTLRGNMSKPTNLEFIYRLSEHIRALH